MKKTFLKLLIFSILLCGTVHAQKPDALEKADSLIRIKQYQDALSEVNLLIGSNPSRFVLSNAYFRLGQVYFGLEDFEKAVQYNRQSLDIRNSLLYELISENYLLFGLIEMKKGDNDKALDYLLKANELPFESPEFAGLLYANIALVYFRKGDREQMIRNYKLAMQTWMNAYEEGSLFEPDRYRARGRRLYYDSFFAGFL